MSGASNCPETPRQKMIGMMYLVLTAMLALNVSVQILDGFTMVDNSLHTTIKSSELRNKALYADFDGLYSLNKEKVEEWLEKAKTVKRNSDELFNYIEDYKVKLVKMADKEDANDSAYVKQLIAKDNLDVASEYGLKSGNGKILRSKIENYKNFLVGLSGNNKSKQQLYLDVFATNGGKDGKSWEESSFESMPISAVITMLTKYQSDIRASEAEIVQYLKGQTDVNDMRVNKVMALVIPNSKYVIKGGKYSAQIILSAVDSTQQPEYYISNNKLNSDKYEVSCNSTGSFTYNGTIRLANNLGDIQSYKFTSDYIVGEPSATVSNEDLNVVYRGIDNKFSISVPGVASENVSVRVTGGTAQKVGTKYIVKANQDKDITIAVFAKIDGKELQMGGGTYRVKYIPDPKAFLQYKDAGGVTRLFREGKLTKRLLKNDVSLIASYGEDELIKANFTVKSFTMLTLNGSVNENGTNLNSRMLSDINKLEGGDLITLKNIKAVGPDGKLRSLGMLQIEL